MNEKEKEITQRAMDLLSEIIEVTGASGKEPHNRIIGLRLFDRKGCIDMFGQPKRDGLFVRPIWSDNPTRDDGYYDICVEGDSPWGAICDVLKNLQYKF